MNIKELSEGYYKVYYQHWHESDTKTGWDGFGWGEEDGYELVEYIDIDKHGNPTCALFKYNGPVYIGLQHCAMNIQAIWLGDYIEHAKKHVGENFKVAFENDDEFRRLSEAIELLEKHFKIKEYRGK